MSAAKDTRYKIQDTEAEGCYQSVWVCEWDRTMDWWTVTVAEANMFNHKEWNEGSRKPPTLPAVDAASRGDQWSLSGPGRAGLGQAWGPPARGYLVSKDIGWQTKNYWKLLLLRMNEPVGWGVDGLGGWVSSRRKSRHTGDVGRSALVGWLVVLVVLLATVVAAGRGCLQQQQQQ